jgi:hypothetical protein
MCSAHTLAIVKVIKTTVRVAVVNAMNSQIVDDGETVVGKGGDQWFLATRARRRAIVKADVVSRRRFRRRRRLWLDLQLHGLHGWGLWPAAEFVGIARPAELLVVVVVAVTVVINGCPEHACFVQVTLSTRHGLPAWRTALPVSSRYITCVHELADDWNNGM